MGLRGEGQKPALIWFCPVALDRGMGHPPVEAGHCWEGRPSRTPVGHEAYCPKHDGLPYCER